MHFRLSFYFLQICRSYMYNCSMTDISNQLQNLLRSSGYSLTTPRKIVFTALQHKEPQTIHDIVASCQTQIDRASVYRTIQLFEQLGVVQRMQIGWKYKLELSDKFSAHHQNADAPS
jgi:Fur family transcriptional regulator, ferric uptake regulator